jgi:hypothetical protein
LKYNRRGRRGWIVVGVWVFFCGAPLSAQDQEPAKKQSAKEVATGWLFKGDPKKVGKVGGVSAAPQDLKLFASMTKIPGGSFEEAWTFYAEKCGAKGEYSEVTMLLTSGKAKEGEYMITDNRDKITGQHATMFTCTTKEYAVTVHIRRDDKKNLYVALSVALH